MLTGLLVACSGDRGEDGTAGGSVNGGMERRCGATFGHDPQGGPLALEVDLPRSVAARERAFVGSARIVNRGEEFASGVAASSADVYVTAAGNLVAMPFDRDSSGVVLALERMGTLDLPATGRLVSCNGGGEALPPGDYEVFVTASIAQESAELPLELVAGPLRLIVE